MKYCALFLTGTLLNTKRLREFHRRHSMNNRPRCFSCVEMLLDSSHSQFLLSTCRLRRPLTCMYCTSLFTTYCILQSRHLAIPNVFETGKWNQQPLTPHLHISYTTMISTSCTFTTSRSHFLVFHFSYSGRYHLLNSSAKQQKNTYKSLIHCIKLSVSIS